MHLPTREQLDNSNFKDQGVLAFMLNQENVDYQHRIPKRPSCDFGAEKTRPLYEKLEILLEYLFQRLDHDPNQPRQFEKSKFLRKIQQMDRELGN